MKDTFDIDRIYDVYARRLYNISLRIVGNSEDAEEAMHDALLKYIGFRRKGDIQDLGAWLSSVCIRKSIDKLRQKHRYKDFLGRYAEMDVSEDNESIQEIDIEKIRSTLASMPDHYRLVLTLHLFEGYDYQEISQITGTKESTVRTLYMRGKQKLAKLLNSQQNG